MFKKIKHIIEFSFISIVIYIDYDAVLNITKQITFITFFIDKLNFRFVKTLNYIQRFNLNIQHKFEV